jgi:hypothetical protein
MAAIDDCELVKKAERATREKMSDAISSCSCDLQLIGRVLLDAVKRGIADEFLGNEGICWGSDVFVRCGIFASSGERVISELSEVRCGIAMQRGAEVGWRFVTGTGFHGFLVWVRVNSSPLNFSGSGGY